MNITRVSDYAFQSPGVWLASTFVALIIVAFVGWTVFNQDEEGPINHRNPPKKRGAGFVVLSFIPALLGSMFVFHLLTGAISIYEGTVTSVAQPDYYQQDSTLLVTMDGVDEPLYVINRGDTEELIATSDEPVALLCEERRMGRDITFTLFCDLLEDKPGSKELEELKSEGLRK